MWRKSKYNVMTTYKDKIALHNLLMHKGVLIEQSDLEKLNNILSTPDNYKECNFFKTFTDYGFIVKDNVDEIELVEKEKYDLLKKKRKTLSLTVIPTYQCNFKCIYCWENTKNTNDNMSEEAQAKLISFVNEQMKESSSLDIDWFGGEPLIAFDVIKNLLVNFDVICKKYNKPYACAMTTNGYALTLDKFKFLLKYHTHFFQITLDGNKNLHNRNRPLKNGSETFDVILNNMRNIRDNIKEQYFKFIIRLNVTEETISNSDEYFEMIEKEFAYDKRFQLYIQSVERHNELRFDEMKDKYLYNQEVIEDLYDYCIDKGIMTYSLKMLRPGDFMCKAMHDRSVFVDPKCGIYKCDMDMCESHVSYMGNLFNDKNIGLQDSRYIYWKSIMNKLDYCNDCILLPLCCGLKCPYYNTLNPKERCEIYNNYSLVKGAVKSYAQHNRYDLISINN